MGSTPTNLYKGFFCEIHKKNLLRARFARELSFIHGEHEVSVVVPVSPKHKTKLDPFHRNAHL